MRTKPMKLNVLIAATALSLALPAAAQMHTVSESYELTLGDLLVPQAEGGTLSFRFCGSCPLKTKRTTANTQWIVNGRSLTLADFRLEVARMPNHSNIDARVLHHLENDRITKVTVSYP